MSDDARTNIPSKRMRNSLMVYVVEDHNDALEHIYRAIGSKRLPFNNIAMVHFDSHPDLLLPDEFDSDRIRDKEYVLNSVSIATWILPAVFAGHINTVAWIKPPWADQMQDGLWKCKIGKHVETHQVKLSCPEPYFVSELLYAPVDEIIDASDVTLVVQSLENTTFSGQTDKVVPSCSMSSTNKAINGDANSNARVDDAKSPVSDKIENFLEKLDLTEKVLILDVDLDFYSTQNPFYLVFSPFQFQTLHKLYQWNQPPKWKDSSEVKAAAKEREDQLNMLKQILIEEFESNLPASSSSTTASSKVSSDDPDDIYAERKQLVHSLVEDIKKSANPEIPFHWKFLHEAGCTFDWSGLPHHVSDDTEIERLVEETKELLKKLPKPTIVTIARSSYDEYCPKNRVDEIQRMVLTMLEELYGSTDVVFDYELEECQERNVSNDVHTSNCYESTTCFN